MLVLLIIIRLCKRNEKEKKRKGKKRKGKKREKKRKEKKRKGKIYRKNYPVKVSVSGTVCLANGSSNKTHARLIIYNDMQQQAVQILIVRHLLESGFKYAVVIT